MATVAAQGGESDGVAEMTGEYAGLRGPCWASAVREYVVCRGDESAEKAHKSFALGRNPHLTYGYLQQLKLQETSQHGVPSGAVGAPPLQLLVMGEEKRHVEKNPHGYVIKDDSVTRLQESNDLMQADEALG
ncbi:hypothetical protein EJB05_14440, partial [Eragrostis curvula]